MDSNRKKWRAAQWAAFLDGQDLPAQARSKLLVLGLEDAAGGALAANQLADAVLGDPFLCIRLLREAEHSRSRRLKSETTTVLAAIMQLGTERVRDVLLSSPEVDTDNLGLMELEARSTLAAQICLRWGAGRHDIHPGEIAVAALLMDAGELLLWAFQPELPMQAKMALQQGWATRSQEAQLKTCGFTFRELTVRCAELWGMPPLICSLLAGSDTVRAQLTRASADAARHLAAGTTTNLAALAHDLAEAKKLIPGATLPWLMSGLIGLHDEDRPLLLAATIELMSEGT